eukprot:Ihof_evm1s717 gene=Ihof_evmTU1s717
MMCNGKVEERLAHVCPIYGSHQMSAKVPKFEMPIEPMTAVLASQIIKDEMNLDGNPKMNLASFVTTFMEPEAEEIMREAARKNFIDQDEYAQTAELQTRCVNMLGRLFHAPLGPEEKAIGTGCIGSSEAIMLAGLAMKWNWRKWRKSKGLSEDAKPNIVMGANVQVVWHKFCRYFEVDAREAPVKREMLVLTKETAKPLIDDCTIGVVGILGSTYNGEFEDIKGIHDMVAELNETKGWEVAVHVDAASGGFIAPFITPDLIWDFQLPWVKSINASGHKFGLVYAGVGWALWRDQASLPEELVFHVNYLGGDQASFTLNFSKGASQIVAQYYQFLRLGFTGYASIMNNGMLNASYLRERIRSLDKFEIVDKAHMPLVAFALKDKNCPYSVFDIQEKLKHRGWIVPAYTCPTGASDYAIMRVVVKQNFSRDMADMLEADISKVCKDLEETCS